MDPLSLTASIIAVIGAGSAVGKGLKKILSARNLPDIVLQLNNEVVDLQYVIQDIQELLQQQTETTLEDQGASSSHASLSWALEQAKRTLLSLESLIAYELTTVDSRNGETKIDWLSWLRAESKVKRLKDDIRTDRVRLSSGLSLLASSTSLRLHGQVRRICFATEPLELPISQARGAIIGRIEAVEGLVRDTFERQSGQEPSITDSPKIMASRSFRSDHDLYQASQSQIGVECNATMLMPTESQASEPDSGVNAYPMILRPLKYPTSQPSLGETTHTTTTFELTRSSCELSCSCVCHKYTRFRSPKFMATIVGSLFLGYNAVPWLSQKCDNTFCRSHSSKLTYTYAFPRWFLDRVIILKISDTTLRGPELCLRLARVRPNNAGIFMAALDDSEEVAVHHIRRLLLAGEASVLDVDPSGETALQKAIKMYNLKAIELLIKAGSDILFEDSRGLSPYIRAWRFILGRRDSSQSSFCDSLSKIFDGRSHLTLFDFPELLSAYLGISGRIFGTVLAQTPRSSIDLVDASGRTTLSWAAVKGDHGAVQKLLSCGADPNHADKDGWTPLHWAVNANNHECVRLLLAAKADVDIKYCNGGTALCIALRSTVTDDPDLVEILISHYADIESISEYGLRPLYYAVRSNKAERLSLLLRKGANIRAVDSGGNTALQNGIIFNCHQTVKILLDHGGIDYDNKNAHGETALHFAALYGDLDTIAILQSANLTKIDHAATDNWGRSALDHAIWRYKHNGKWSNWALRPMDEDPPLWFDAFKALWDDVVQRQESAHGEEDGENEEEEEDEELEDEDCKDEDCKDEDSGDENSGDEEWEEKEREVEEQEDWQDASEFAEASSE